MRAFVFQSVPDRYDLRQSLKPGAGDTWYVTRYRNLMRAGDLVFFWMAGDEYFRGLYGWGHLTSAPYLKGSWDSYGVDVAYEVKFGERISARIIRGDRALASLLILRAPQATNFLVTDAELKRLVRVIQDRGEAAPNLTEAKS